jgi:MFS family permease
MRRPARLWPKGDLWRHGDFLKLWSAETISVFGSQVGQFALPLVAIITLDATAFQVALLGTIAFTPFILFSLPAGVWVDRLPRRPILIVADVGRAAALVTVPVAYFLDALTIWQLYAVGFAGGTMTVFFDVSYQSYLPSLVRRDQLVEGNSKLEMSRSGAQIAGPGLAGGLVELLTAPLTILANSISFLASAVFLVLIRKPETVPQRTTGRRNPLAGMRGELAEGLRYVLGHRLLRPIAACTAVSNLFNSFIFAILLVYAVRELGLSPGVIGGLLSVSNVGFLAGAVLATRIARRFGVGRTIVGTSATFGPALLLIPLAPQALPHPFLVAAVALAGFGGVAYNITQVSLRQSITPERMQGRMNSVMRFVVWGVIPVGSLAGGALATRIGLRPTLLIGAAGACFAVLPVLLSPVRSLREMPGPPEDPGITVADGAADGGVVVPPAAPAPAGPDA